MIVVGELRCDADHFSPVESDPRIVVLATATD